MPNYKYILKSFSYFLISILLTLILLSTLNYFNVISYKVVYIISFISVIVSMFFSGFYLAKHSTKKGYLIGLFIGIVLVLFMVILSLIIYKITWMSLIYYLILLVSCVAGGIFGINKN